MRLGMLRPFLMLLGIVSLTTYLFATVNDTWFECLGDRYLILSTKHLRWLNEILRHSLNLWGLYNRLWLNVMKVGLMAVSYNLSL
jgi:hypothetical protein